MPAQTPTQRPSLQISLEERYNTQKAGGAYDAKSIETAQGQRMPIYAPDGISPSLIERQWTVPNFLVKESFGTEEFNDRALNMAASSGVSTKRYKP